MSCGNMTVDSNKLWLATAIGMAVALVALFLWVTHEKQEEKELLSTQLAKCELALKGAKAELGSFEYDLKELQSMIDKALLGRVMFLKWMEEMSNFERERTITKVIGKDLGTTVYQPMTYERNYKEPEKRKSFRSSKSCPIE